MPTAEINSPVITYLPQKPIASTATYPYISRAAIDPSGDLGSLYDIYTDRVLSFWNIFCRTKSTIFNLSPECLMKSFKTDEPHNLLRLCEINQEFRLTLASKIISAKGISAVVHYKYGVDQYTRFIIYKYYSRVDQLADSVFDTYNKTYEPKRNTNETHVITQVNWGIHAVAILQLPPDDESVTEIEHVLGKICDVLSDRTATLILSDEEKLCLNKIYRTETFSNIDNLMAINSIIDFHNNIRSLLRHTNLLKPCDYNLCSLDYFCEIGIQQPIIISEWHDSVIDRLESYLILLLECSNRLNEAVGIESTVLKGQSKPQFRNIRELWKTLKPMVVYKTLRIRKLILEFRRGQIQQDRIENEINNEISRETIDNANQLLVKLNAFEEKELFIRILCEKGIIYKDANDLDINMNDNEYKLKEKLSRGVKNACFMCATDQLYRHKLTKWNNSQARLIEEHNKNREFGLIYVDFSYSSYKLNDVLIFTTEENKHIAGEPENDITPMLKPHTDDDIINILLLGESGVGKSTFINALANYLKYEELEQAEKSPIILLTVSFLLTVYEDSTENVLKVEDNGILSNENYSDPDQCATQHCNSYVFTIHDKQGYSRKLRIIDTPGVGNTRSVNHDQRNLQHILSYVSNLTHLNAICILLRPDNTRLNISFRTCLLQLMDMIGQNNRERVMFCFSNSRATFYTPGETAPILRSLLESIPGNKIPFAKENSFCFDNEAFRYLTAKKNGIFFDESDLEVYQNSWQTSYREINRLLDYISSNKSNIITLNESTSMTDVQQKVHSMVRPILEAIRNSLRNLVLLDEASDSLFIELYPRETDIPSAICLKCPLELIEVAGFRVKAPNCHAFLNYCRTCRCSASSHYSVEYELAYETSNESSATSEDEMRADINFLCRTAAEFAEYLSTSQDSGSQDLFLLGFEDMIKEEDDICKTSTCSTLNKKLKKRIEELKVVYENERKDKVANKDSIQSNTSDAIYAKIDELNKNHFIRVQMNAIQQSRTAMVKNSEHEVTL